MRERNKFLALFKDFLWVLTIIFVVLGAARFAIGLGAATNMTDAMPWGWWKIFNMVAGAAVATSGFIIAAVIYILQLKEYKPVARLSIVVGFLGYGASLAALMFDIGLPHRGWHGFLMWNPHSFLFEVFWCVSIYWSITALELLPLVTERFSATLTHLLHELMLPFVVLGVTLSTMHHSSLGSLFLASPTRLHPLWYTLWMPPEFLLSAMGAGLSTMVLVLLVLNRLYDREDEIEVMSRLARASAAFLALFLVLKVIDFTYFQKWNFVFGPDLTWESGVFWVEITLQTLVPIALFSVPALTRRKWVLWVGTLAAFFGLMLHRLDVGIIGYFRSAGQVYIPSASELFLSFGLLAAAGLTFLFLVEHFHVLDEPEDEHNIRLWTWGEIAGLATGYRARRTAQMALVVVPLTLLSFQGAKGTHGYVPLAQPIHPAIMAVDATRSALLINGDRDDNAVYFPHDDHVEAFMKADDLAEEDTCVSCHHLDLPGDQHTACRGCHRDMELSTPLFDWDKHADRFETPKDYAAFVHADLEDRRQNFEACSACHDEEHDQPMLGLASYKSKGFDQRAPGFRIAMHGSCLTCHRREMEDPTDAMATGNCRGCHQDRDMEQLAAEVDADDLVAQGNALVLAGDLPAAETYYRQAISADPDDPKAWYQLGVMLKVAGRTDEALEALQTATRQSEHRDARRARRLLEVMKRESQEAG